MKSKRVILFFLILCATALVGSAIAGSGSGNVLAPAAMKDLVGGVTAGCVLAGAGPPPLGALVGGVSPGQRQSYTSCNTGADQQAETQ